MSATTQSRRALADILIRNRANLAAEKKNNEAMRMLKFYIEKKVSIEYVINGDTQICRLDTVLKGVKDFVSIEVEGRHIPFVDEHCAILNVMFIPSSRTLFDNQENVIEAVHSGLGIYNARDLRAKTFGEEVAEAIELIEQGLMRVATERREGIMFS